MALFLVMCRPPSVVTASLPHNFRPSMWHAWPMRCEAMTKCILCPTRGFKKNLEISPAVLRFVKRTACPEWRCSFSLGLEWEGTWSGTTAHSKQCCKPLRFRGVLLPQQSWSGQSKNLCVSKAFLSQNQNPHRPTVGPHILSTCLQCLWQQWAHG